MSDEENAFINKLLNSSNEEIRNEVAMIEQSQLSSLVSYFEKEMSLLVNNQLNGIKSSTDKDFNTLINVYSILVETETTRSFSTITDKKPKAKIYTFPRGGK